MNTKSWAELLRHFLYLFVFVDVAAGVVYMIMAESCLTKFKEHELVPIGLNINHNPIEVSVDLTFALVKSIGFSAVLISLFGFIGICCLNKWDTINFTFGILMVKTTFFSFVTAHALNNILKSYDDIIEGSMKEVFRSVNKFNVSKHIGGERSPLNVKRYRKNNPFKIYNLPFTEYGWSLASDGGIKNQTKVDFIQLNLACCGLTGRTFWDMRIPRSCCPNEYRGDRCILSAAHSKSCLYDYRSFRDCGGTIRAEFICFGIIALLTSMDSLYLAYLKVQFPDGDFKSDRSSSEEEEELT